ncbi:hypothetical protein MY4038_003273 [Beauveria bassiana]
MLIVEEPGVASCATAELSSPSLLTSSAWTDDPAVQLRNRFRDQYGAPVVNYERFTS